MDEFLRTLLTPPALFFSLLMAVAVLYWLMVIIGALDIDLLHVGDTHGGHGHDVGDHGGHDGGHDGGDGHVAGHHSFLHGVLEFLSVGKVPVTIIGSLLTLFGWTSSMVGQLTLKDVAEQIMPGWTFAAGLFSAACAVALPVTAAVVRPLRNAFRQLETVHQGGISLVGRLARVTSASVDQSFGTAVCTIEGADIIMNVVSSRADLRFAKDEQVVVVHYDDERQVHVIGPATMLVPASTAPQPRLQPDLAQAPAAALDATAAADASPASAPLTHSTSSQRPRTTA